MVLRTILEWQIAYQLLSVPGVVEVNPQGVELKTCEIQVDPNKLFNFWDFVDASFRCAKAE